jgi:hypothetical protein
VLGHTFGTRWLQAGGDIYKLSKILGHSSVAVTEAHYAHLLKEDLVAASQQIKIPVAPRGWQSRAHAATGEEVMAFLFHTLWAPARS